MKNGIDISYCQAGLDLKQAKAEGAEFAIIRAGISTRTDTEFLNHVKGAKAAGLPYGFYWYSRAFSAIEAKSEAEACLKAIKDYKPTYPIFYDIEEGDQIEGLSLKERTDIICAFCEEIKKAGYTAGVYLNPSWIESYVEKKAILNRYPLWLAHWTNSPDKESCYDYDKVIWQWGAKKICGMEIDADICYMELDENVKDKAEDGGESTDAMLPPGIEADFLGGEQYKASGADVGVKAPADRIKITNRAKGAPHPYHVISIGKGGVYGWVDADKLKATDKRTNLSADELEKTALEVIAGKWGNGEERRKRLTAACYDYDKIQTMVNKLIK